MTENQEQGSVVGEGSELEKLKAAAAEQSVSSDDHATSASDEVPPQPEADLVDIEFEDGVRQKFKKSDLAALLKKSQSLEEMERTANRMLEETVGAKAWLERIRQFDDDAKSALFEFLEKPELLKSRKDPIRLGDEDDDASGNLSPAVLRQIEELKQQVAQQSAFIQKQVAEQRQKSLVDEVSSAMDSFDVFKNSPGHKEFMLGNVINRLRVDPNLSLKDAVYDAASATHKLLASERAPQPSADPRGRSRVEPPKPDARNLESGGIARFIMEQMKK